MHRPSPEGDRLADAVVDYALRRVRMDPPPLDGPRTSEQLSAAAGRTITDEGIGGDEALRVFGDVLAPATISTDHPRFLAFVPAAPTESSILGDLLVSASSIYAGSWKEGAGLVFAENEALRFLADEFGLPASSGGVFVSGGTAGNLSALVTARDRHRHTHPGDRGRPVIVTSAESHSSVQAAAKVMDCDVVTAPAAADRRLTGAAVRTVLEELDDERRAQVIAVVATAGTTNLGVIDDLAGVGAACSDHDLWFHVDGAYGGAGRLAPSARARYDGIELADSIIVDPHKWLFAPFDACALLWRDPDTARRSHTQSAGYLDVLADGDPNPSDMAHHLSRRARGVPFWFSLAVHGVNAYRAALETTLSTAAQVADLVSAAPALELVAPPSLGVVCFRRLGWTCEQYHDWSDRLLRRGQAFVTPTSVDGETVLRLCLVNPRTTVEDCSLVLGTLSS